MHGKINMWDEFRAVKMICRPMWRRYIILECCDLFNVELLNNLN